REARVRALEAEGREKTAELHLVLLVAELRGCPTGGLHDALPAVDREGDRPGIGRVAEVEGVEALSGRGVDSVEHAVLARVEGQIARRRQHPAGIAVLGFLIPPDFPARCHVPGVVYLVSTYELSVLS